MCAIFKQNVEKFNAIAHTKRFALTQLHPNHLLIQAIGEPKKFTGAVCQNLTQLKFSLRFLRENSSNTCLKLMIRSW